MVEMVTEVVVAPCSAPAPPLNTSAHHWARSHSTVHWTHTATMHHHRTRTVSMPATTPTTSTPDAAGTRKTAAASHPTTASHATATMTATATPTAASVSCHGG
jgi:hypothetical protein